VSPQFKQQGPCYRPLGSAQTSIPAPSWAITPSRAVSPPPSTLCNARFRMTKDGTFLSPYLNMDRVVEYDKDFKVMWSYDIAAP